jgi:anti-sigma factor RsiW
MAASVEAIRQESALLRAFSRPYAVGEVEARIAAQVRLGDNVRTSINRPRKHLR